MDKEENKMECKACGFKEDLEASPLFADGFYEHKVVCLPSWYNDINEPLNLMDLEVVKFFVCPKCKTVRGG